MYVGWMYILCFFIILVNESLYRFGINVCLWLKEYLFWFFAFLYGFSRYGRFMWNKEFILWFLKRFVLFILNGLLTEKRVI